MESSLKYVGLSDGFDKPAFSTRMVLPKHFGIKQAGIKDDLEAILFQAILFFLSHSELYSHNNKIAAAVSAVQL